MSLATDIAAAAELAQAALEAAYPVTVTIGGTAFAAAGAAPRNVPNFDAHGGGTTETRERVVHIRRTLLAAASVTIVPGATDATLDSVTWKITALDSPRQSLAFRLTLSAAFPAAAQTT